MAIELYRDFRLTIDNCDTEPIHRPIATQGHGHILVFDQKRPSHLYAMDSHFSDWIGWSVASLWHHPIESWLPRDLMETVNSVRSMESTHALAPVAFSHQGKTFDATIHVHQGKGFVEIEPSAEASPSSWGIFGAMERMRACDNFHQLFESIPECIREITGFDRVMIYRFDPDFHGMVVGEPRRRISNRFSDCTTPQPTFPV